MAATALAGDVWRTRFALTPSDLRADVWFGASAATAIGRDAVVGASQRLPGFFASRPGFALLFDLADGAILHRLEAPGGTVGDLFGSAVAMSEDHVLVGAREADLLAPDAGAAYVFERLTGAHIHTFVPDGGGDPLAAAFGRAVALDDREALISAPGEALGTGAIYLFDLATGAQRTYRAPSSGVGVNWGASVALQPDLILVGAPGEDRIAGAVVAFDRRDGRLVTDTLGGELAQTEVLVGAAVAATDVTLVIGAPGFDRRVGRVAVYDLPSTDFVRTIAAPADPLPWRFGATLVLTGDRLIVGAPGELTNATTAGEPYTFDVATGALPATLTTPGGSGMPDDSFGSAIAISRRNAVVGTLHRSPIKTHDRRVAPQTSENLKWASPPT